MTIGGYELVRRIGRGGMAEVWVARKALGRKGSKFVAIKLIADHYVGDERYARMFRSEAELAAVLSHANIVQVFDEGEEDGRSYLIMEWVDGLNLLKLGDMLALLDDEQRRFRVISYIIGQLLHALNYAHSITSHDGSPLGVVHRDVSPQNVLVSNHGEVKLTDFGVAYYNIEESSGIHVKGKVRYMSPEQLSGRTRSPTVDLYAVGALLHELLDGRKFRGEFEDGQDLFTVVLAGQISQMSRRVPPELDRLRLGLLEPDVNRRIQTAEQAVAWLKHYPGYGDARDELSKLCGSLTGVVRPRVGPGQSSQVAAAEQATTRWGGRTPLAKPKVEAKVGLGRPPKPRVKPPSAPRGMGSITTVKGPASAPKSTPLITGQTEFVQPQVLPGGAAPVSTVAPTTPLRVNNLRAMMAVPAARGPSAGAPAHAAPQPSRPLAIHAVEPASEHPTHAPGPQYGYGGPAPAYVPEQPSSPIGVSTSAAPMSVAGQGSRPIYVQPSPGPGIPPTERLVSSEASGAASHPTGTEVLDASMILEVSSNSGTDQEPLAFAGVPHEGTDTRRELRGGASSRTGSVSIVLPRRSAMAAIGLGLVLVAVMSVTVTWYLFAPGHDGDAAAKSLAASMVQPSVPPSAASAAEAKPSEAEPVDAEPADAEPSEEQPTVVSAGGEEPEPVHEVLEQAPEPSPTDAQPGEVDVEVDGDQAHANEAKPSAADPDPPKKPVKLPKAVVRVMGSSGLEKAQVRVGSETFGLNDSNEHRVTPGRKTIKWRKTPSEDWQSSPSWNFKPGKRFIIYVNKKGPTVRPTS